MIRGAGFLLVSVSLAAAGCAATHDLQVRPIADQAAKFRYGGDLLGQGRAQLAMGNAGLALETFRKLLREQPASADAFAGIAACYAAMGRYDLERANYEFALAYAPNDPALLSALASSLERLGESEQAAHVRSEAARLRSVPITHAPAEQVAIAPLAVPRLSSVTVKLPPVARTAEAPVVAAPQLTTATVHLPSARAAVLKAADLKQYADILIRTPQEAPTPSAPALPKPQPDVLADRLPEPQPARVEMRVEQGPYMKRLSSGEVALITSSPVHSRPQPATPVMRAEAAAAVTAQPSPRPMLASALRWVPLKYASAASTNIVLLNAARSQRLAARTRTALLDRGWRKIGIGDARGARQRSLVLYSPMRAVTARRLAAQFGCKAVRVGGVDKIIVLLGRDAVLPKTPSRA